MSDLFSPRGVFKGTREEWLEAAGDILGARIDEMMNAKSDFGKQGRLNPSNNLMPLKSYLSSHSSLVPLNTPLGLYSSLILPRPTSNHHFQLNWPTCSTLVHPVLSSNIL